MPLKSPPKNGLVMSGMTTASTVVRPRLSPRATPFGRYSVSRSSASIRVRVAGAIRRPGSWLTTREIVDGCTLARAAVSFSVVGTYSGPRLTFVPPVNTIGQSFVHSKRFCCSNGRASMRRRLMTAVIATLGLTAAHCGGRSTPGAQGAPITIGVSESLSGDFSSDGKALEQGYDLWMADVNARGGLAGHNVTMKYVDAPSSTQQVVTNYQNLITVDKVALVFGPFSSLLTIPASTVVDRYGYAFPEPAGGGPHVFDRGLKSVFFVQPAAVEDNLVSYTKWLLALPSGQRPASAAYATQDDPFTEPQVDKAKTLLEAAGVKTAYYHVYPAETTDFTPIALQVASTKADAVILGTQLPDAVAFAKTFIQQQFNPKTIIETTGPDQGSQFSDKLGSNTEGIMVPAGWTTAAKAYGNDVFVKEFIAKYGGTAADISADAAEAYSGGQVVEKAATKAGSIDNTTLINTLHSGTYNTIQGPMSFDATGKPQGGVGVYIEQWQGGGARLVYPSTIAAAPPEYPKKNWQ